MSNFTYYISCMRIAGQNGGGSKVRNKNLRVVEQPFGFASLLGVIKNVIVDLLSSYCS